MMVAYFSASCSASPGGTMERKKSAATTSSSLTARMPASPARLALASLRPASEVVTCKPCSTRRAPTPLPIAPCATIATTGFIPAPLMSRQHHDGRRARQRCFGHDQRRRVLHLDFELLARPAEEALQRV